MQTISLGYGILLHTTLKFIGKKRLSYQQDFIVQIFMGRTWQKGVNTAETNSLMMIQTSLSLHMCLRVLLGHEPKKQSQKSFLFTLKFYFSTSGPSTHGLKFLTEICSNGTNIHRQTLLSICTLRQDQMLPNRHLKGGAKRPISATPHKFSLFLFRKQNLHFRDQKLLSAYCPEETTQMHTQLGLLTWPESSGDARGCAERGTSAAVFPLSGTGQRHFCQQKQLRKGFLWTVNCTNSVFFMGIYTLTHSRSSASSDRLYKV